MAQSVVIDNKGIAIWHYTLSDRIGSALAWHTNGRTIETQSVSKSCDLQCACAYTSRAQGALPCKGWGVTASQLDLPSLDAIIHSWLWSTATGSCPWATSVALLQVVDN